MAGPNQRAYLTPPRRKVDRRPGSLAKRNSGRGTRRSASASPPRGKEARSRGRTQRPRGDRADALAEANPVTASDVDDESLADDADHTDADHTDAGALGEAAESGFSQFTLGPTLRKALRA